MRLIIEIPDAMYENAVNDLMCGNFADRIKQGNVLPKNHGRLIDADAYKEQNGDILDCEIDHPKYQDTLRELIDNAPTIIEADKETEHADK